PSAWSTSQSIRIERSPSAVISTTARRLRPTRRWISCVRPPGPRRSRSMRSPALRGSMAYSAVTQPRPWPRRKGGTLSCTVAVHTLIQKIGLLVRKVAVTDATILIMGESGTGKELVARAIHAASPRADRPFIPVNCGAIPAELLESEMFGHERGAFTGAIGQRAGMFQLANGGTIFLDEVGEMSPTLQVKLLRVLQDREVRPVGADRVLKVDVRVIAASNKDLAAEVEEGNFREDLFYRLQVIPIVMPPLRERRSDIPLLTGHFLDKHNRKRSGRPARIAEEAMVHLWEYDWPGNVRELENLLERLVILS